MKFYTFLQNYVAGEFHFNDDVTSNVIIEAESADEANSIFENIGYFDGYDKGIDCYCCGDRWVRVGEHNADDIPRVYGVVPVEEYKSHSSTPYAYVYYKNGVKRSF